jgi:nucleotide-binding universal stress UspA family protein
MHDRRAGPRPVRPDTVSARGETVTGTIVCGINNSSGARAAVRVAIELGERFGARVVLVTVAHGLVVREGSETPKAVETRAEARRLFEQLVLDDELAGRVEQRVEAGDFSETLVEVAAEEAAGLIVVGARHRTLRRTLRSALAREIVASSPCPVLVVPDDSAHGPGGGNVVAALPRSRA